MRHAEGPNREVERLGVVAIGRNEGERLLRCLESVIAHSNQMVYVDSDSTDGSADAASALGVEVHRLDLRKPFTAARARNEGVECLLARWPEVELIQFVDGDCVVDATWIETAVAFLDAHPDVVAVCGRRRERFPERSVYNRLCDLEWDTPVGETKACGGDVLMRRDAFVNAGGFRADLIAGEEPELCVRLRRRGGRIWRIDHEMTIHDAALMRLGQWWQRSMRAGYAFAQGAWLHGAPPERHWVREARSALAWGFGLPLLFIAGAALSGPWVLIGLVVYPLQFFRLYRRTAGTPRVRRARAFFLVFGKFAEAVGELQFHMRLLVGRPGRLIEYK